MSGLHILLCSGPAGSGKDTVAMLLKQKYPHMHHEKFALPLRETTKAFFGWTDLELEEYKRMDPRVRKFMIALSENVVKPIHGEGYFAEKCADRVIGVARLLGSRHGLWCISDCGFQTEMNIFCRRIWDSTAATPLLVRITRPGYAFDANDSREEVYMPPGIGGTIEIANNGSLEDLKLKLETAINL